MKKILFKTIAITVAIIAGMCIATYAQNKKGTAPKKTTERWIKVYRNIMLGDQSNTTHGSFLKTATGEVVSVENADQFQKEIGLVFFTEYNANYATLTFPGNASSAASYGTDDIGTFTEKPGGMNHWEQGNLTSGELTAATLSGEDMSQSTFNTVAESNDWNEFSKVFRQYNSGSGKLSYTIKFAHVEGNTVYMFQLSNTVRGFIYVKNLVPKSAKGGSITFDMIIEGSDEYNNSDAKVLQPGKN